MRKKTLGFTLIEMLVGIVIGMIVVAAASVMMVTVLKSQKDITASARLNQELGAAMAVMSNEIRRAGFRVCDADVFICPDNDDDGEEDLFIPSYALGDDIKIGDGGNCIEYRYNADLDNASSTLGEQRAFRFKINKIQMSDINKNVSCSITDLGDSDKWGNLTDPQVIDITALSFSTIGSKCRNMTKINPASIAEYWIVKDKTTAGDIQTGMACDNGGGSTSPGATTPVDYCAVTDPPTVPLCVSGKTVDTSIVKTGDKLFGTRQIIITLDAILTRDQTVTKILTTSVKVANPQIEIAQ